MGPDTKPSAHWRIEHSPDDDAIETAIGELGFGDCLSLSGRHDKVGERSLHIHGLGENGFFVQWQSLNEAEYEFFLAGSPSRLGAIEMRHENGQLDEVGARYSTSVRQAAIAARAFIASGDRASELMWDFTEEDRA